MSVGDLVVFGSARRPGTITAVNPEMVRIQFDSDDEFAYWFMRSDPWIHLAAVAVKP